MWNTLPCTINIIQHQHAFMSPSPVEVSVRLDPALVTGLMGYEDNTEAAETADSLF
jgi:hypothetical protein